MHPPRARTLVPLAVLVASVVAAGAAAARPFEVPAFAIDPAGVIDHLEVAAGTDGSMLFAWEDGGSVRVQRHDGTGAPLAAPLAVASGEHPELAADTRGGFVVAFTRHDGSRRRLHARRLDAAGAPVGDEIGVDQWFEGDALRPTVLGLPSGFALVWQQGPHCWLRRYDPDGAPLGDAVLVGDNGGGHVLVGSALADGGVAVVWHDPSVHTTLGANFAPDGSLRAGPRFLPSAGLEVQAMAPTASGGVVVTATFLLSHLRLVELDADFDLVRQRDADVMPAGDAAAASALARDAQGRWLLTWATARYDAGYTQLLGYLPPRAQPLAADLTPLEPSFTLAPDGAVRVASATLPSGSVASAWEGDGRGRGAVVSLCTSDVHVCGDGVHDPRCEECDDGAGNDDGVPDACRTTCRLPSCGDGVADAGEACDDGTASPCDGCDGVCQPVAGLACGDGIHVAGCADQCDDGNAVAGDGCAPACTLERIPGGGSRATDCLAEWMVVNPSNAPLLDGRGRIRRTQSCRDDDPACDFDGGAAGGCAFRVAVCANNGDVPGCVAAPLATLALVKPSIAQAVRRPELAAVRAAFAAVPAPLVGSSVADVCSSFVEVVVPLRGKPGAWRPGKSTLGIAAATADGARDRDTLKLVCVP